MVMMKKSKKRKKKKNIIKIHTHTQRAVNTELNKHNYCRLNFKQKLKKKKNCSPVT